MKKNIEMIAMMAITLIVFARPWANPAGEGHEHSYGQPKMAQAKSSTLPGVGSSQAMSLTGEVLDMSCYMGHGGMGKDHAKCAKMCLLGGSPAGLLLQDGSVLLIVEDHRNAKVYQTVRNYAGEKVQISGTVHNRAGLRAIAVEKISAAK